jgi:hypothetical protein
MSTLKEPNGPIEVWLSKPNMQVTCRIVFEDETDTSLSVDSLSMRGAQREITAYLIRHEGYEPVDRWQDETEDEQEGETLESSRHFRLKKGPGTNR